MGWWHCVDKEDGTKEIWVETERWFDARNVGRQIINLNVTTTRAEMPPHERAYAKGLVYKGYWTGHAAGSVNTIQFNIEQVLNRAESKTKKKKKGKKNGEPAAGRT